MIEVAPPAEYQVEAIAKAVDEVYGLLAGITGITPEIIASALRDEGHARRLYVHHGIRVPGTAPDDVQARARLVEGAGDVLARVVWAAGGDVAVPLSMFHGRFELTVESHPKTNALVYRSRPEALGRWHFQAIGPVERVE